MRYISLFSGVEAASVAWAPLGWEPLAFCEVDEFPSAVLATRFPDVPNLGDVTKVDWEDFYGRYGAADVLIGGSPCQSFSIAGNREGLKGESGLMFEYIRAIRDLLRVSGNTCPRYILWENVPGALSSERGNAFGQLLAELDECGYGLAWRVLDAQFARVPDRSAHGFFGPVPQRRRRVFLVGSLGSPHAAEILFERSSLLGDYPKGREAREALAEHLEGCSGMGDSAGFKYHQGSAARGVGYEPGQSPTLTADYHQPAIMFRGDATPKFSEDVSITLRVGGDGGTHDAVALDGGRPCMSRCMKCGCAAKAEIDDPQEPQEFWRWSVGCSNMGCKDYVHPRRSFKTVEEAAADWNEYCRRYVRDALEGAPDVLTPWDVQSKRVNTPEGTSPTLPSGTGEGMNIQPIVMTTANTSANGSNVNQDGASYTLDGTNSNAVAFSQNTRDEVRLFGGDGDTVGALAAQPGMKQQSYVCMSSGQANAEIREDGGGAKPYLPARVPDSSDGGRQRQSSCGRGNVRLLESRGGCAAPSNGEEVIGALCARDFKGVGSQYVSEGKVICERRTC